jgi:hypothetical protein
VQSRTDLVTRYQKAPMVTLVPSWFSPGEKSSRERLVGPRAALRGIVCHAVQKEKQLRNRAPGLQLGGGAFPPRIGDPPRWGLVE